MIIKIPIMEIMECIKRNPIIKGKILTKLINIRKKWMMILTIKAKLPKKLIKASDLKKNIETYSLILILLMTIMKLLTLIGS